MQQTQQWLRQQWRDFWRLNPNLRRWDLSVASALASGLPLFVGAAFGHIEYGLVSSLGGMTFLYMPPTRLLHRMVFLLCAAACMTASFLCGLVAHQFPWAMVAVITVLTMAMTALCRFVQVAPPGNLFFLMSAMIAAYMPITVEQIPYQVGLLFMGALLACVVAFLYSLYLRFLNVPVKPPATIQTDGKSVVVDSIIIGVFAGAALLIAQLFAMPKPYWVPVSCLAVLQGINFDAVWQKQLHRIVGTAAGVVLAWVLLKMPLNVWMLCVVMMCLNMIIELLVVRHYALAVVFITPLTIFLVEAGAVGYGAHPDVAIVAAARFWDTLLGCVTGLAGGYCLHKLGLRDWLAKHLQWLWQNRSSA